MRPCALWDCAGNFLVCRSPPHHPALLDFGLTKELPREMQRALAKMLLATAEVRRTYMREHVLK